MGGLCETFAPQFALSITMFFVMGITTSHVLSLFILFTSTPFVLCVLHQYMTCGACGACGDVVVYVGFCMVPGVVCGIKAHKRFNEQYKMGGYALQVHIHALHTELHPFHYVTFSLSLSLS